MYKIKFPGFILVGCLFIGCSQALYIPASENTAEQESLLLGRKYYIASCGNCHSLYKPNYRTVEGWKKDIDEMQVRAKISDETKHLIYQYLTSQPKIN